MTLFRSKWHPATFLVLWIGLVFFLTASGGVVRLFASVMCLLLAFVFAAQRTARLLKRTRWLLLAIVCLGLFLTPGEFLPGILGELGVSYEGMHAVGEQLGLILGMLSSLALVHEKLGTSGMVEALFALMYPLPGRNKTIVRLMLVIEWVERDKLKWRDWIAEDRREDPQVATVSIQNSALHLRDWIVMGMVVVAMLAGVVWR